jgi:opacity protein-like surface antigen
MKKLIGAFLLATSVAAPAVAGDSPFYIGAEVGKDHFGALGGYKFDDMFAVEMNYNVFDDESVAIPGMSIDTEAWSFGVSGVGTFQIAAVPGLSVFGKLGLERLEVEVTTKYDWFGTAYTTTVSEDDIDFTASGGAQYEFTPDFSVRAGIHFKGQADSVYANAIYTF